MFIAAFFLASLIETSIDVNFKVLGRLIGPEWLNFKANVYRLTFCQDSASGIWQPPSYYTNKEMHSH